MVYLVTIDLRVENQLYAYAKVVICFTAVANHFRGIQKSIHFYQSFVDGHGNRPPTDSTLSLAYILEVWVFTVA